MGCAPIPHNDYFAPRISGVLTINGTPATQRKVYLGSAIKMNSCESEPLVATTNDKGEFEIGPIKEFRFFAIFFGDPAAIWELCAEHNHKLLPFLHQNGHFSPDMLRVKCDLEKASEELENTSRGVSGKCVLVDS